MTGISEFSGTAGVWGQHDGIDGNGVYGLMTGDLTSCPPGSTHCASGVYGTASGDAYASFFYGQNRSSILAVQGDNEFYTLWANSLIYPGGGGIYTNGESRFENYVIFNGGKSGYVVDIARNGGTEVLERGDVVVITAAMIRPSWGMSR